MELKLSMKIQNLKEKILNENPRILLGIIFPWFHVDDHQNLLIMISVVKTHIGMFGQHRLQSSGWGITPPESFRGGITPVTDPPECTPVYILQVVH